MKDYPISVGIVGGGVVGSAMNHVYDRPDVNVTCCLYDINPKRSKHTLSEVLVCDVIMICLPTPNGEMNALDISVIDDFFAKNSDPDKVYIIRSTVPIGTCRTLAKKHDLDHLYYMPEFLTERTALNDAENPYGVVVGADIRFTAPRLVLELCSRVYPWHNPVFDSYDTVEMTKLSLNAFYAVKVSFFNELRRLCDAVMGSSNKDASYLDSRYEDLIYVMLGVSPMLEESHTKVPGPDGKRGFGGKCLPKDTCQFAQHLMDHGIDPVMTMGALARCAYDRFEDTKNTD